jgi:hypothetical protein
MPQYEKRYFAAANSCNGFVSFFDDIYKNVDKLYIIKGGPGTGKSKLMRDIANEACNKNYDVEYFYCSSDPLSLDGIIITDLNLGVIDGTAPHIRDPKFPGICEEIVNTGDFWKVPVLNVKHDLIRDIINRKGDLYDSVYRYLAAADEIDCDIKSITCASVNYDKLISAVKRIAKTIKSGSGYNSKIRMLNAISVEGEVSLPTFHDLAEHNYIIRDNYNTAYILLRELLCIAKIKNQPVYVSYSPLNTAFETALYFPEISTSFTIGESNVTDKIINMERFIDTDYIKQHKNKIKFGQRCYRALIDGALDYLKEIKSLHTTLESIYISAMDFKRKEEFTKKLLIKMFK